MPRTLENYSATENVLVCKACRKEVPDSENCISCEKPLVLVAKANGGPNNG